MCPFGHLYDPSTCLNASAGHFRHLVDPPWRRFRPGIPMFPLVQTQLSAISSQKRARIPHLPPPADGPSVIEPDIDPSLGIVSITRNLSARLGPRVAPLAPEGSACQYLRRAGHGQERRIRAGRRWFGLFAADRACLAVVTLAVAGCGDRIDWHQPGPCLAGPALSSLEVRH